MVVFKVYDLLKQLRVEFLAFLVVVTKRRLGNDARLLFELLELFFLNVAILLEVTQLVLYLFKLLV